MKRMYGEERHINVIKAEFDKNELDSPDFVGDYQFSSYKVHDGDYDGRKYSGRSYGETKRNGKFPKVGDHVKPHFKLSENAAGTKSSKTTTTPESTTVTPSQSTVTTTTEQVVTTNETATTRNNTDETTISTPALLSLAQIAKIKNFSSNEIPSQVDRIDEDSTEFLSDETTTEDSVDTEDSTELPTTLKDSYEEVKISSEEDEEEADQTFAASEQEEKFRPRPEYRPDEKKPAMQGQLFQDVDSKEQEQAVLKLRGA